MTPPPTFPPTPNPTHLTSLARWFALTATLTLTLAALSSGAHAQSVTNGRTVYITPQVSGQLSCANAQCHGSDPTVNQNRIRNGANNPAAISAAIGGGVSTMAFLRGKLTNSQLSDLAAYIANPSATNTAPVATLSTTTLGFGAVNTGATSALQTITLSNTGAASLQLSSITVSSAEFARVGGSCSATTALAVSASCTMNVSFTPASVGVRFAMLTVTHNASMAASTVSLAGTGVAPTADATTPMVEFYFPALDYYFITSSATDIATLDGFANWQRTGKSFKVYVNEQPGSSGINRYYFDQIAVNKSRGSHFYTLVQSEKDILAGINPGNSRAPGLPYFEGVESHAFTPPVPGVGGFCAAGLTSVYRLFRGQAKFPDNPNHRFTTDTTVYNAFVALGWDGEGVKFCVPG